MLRPVLLLVLLAGAAAAQDRAYEQEMAQYRQKRLERLQSDTGWLTVAGLYWLEVGPNAFGTDPSNQIVLPEGSAPAHAGMFQHALEGRTSVHPGKDVTILCDGSRVRSGMVLRTDADPETDVLELRRLRMFVIKRGARYAIRLRDLDSPQRTQFRGIEVYDTDPAYRVEARFEAYEPARGMPIANIIGTIDTMRVPGALVFELQGRPLRLDAIQEDPQADSFFMIFHDETSGVETYGGGRYLYTDLPQDGRVVLDFNKSYNPPCAFTPFATCPLPPPQNRLPIAIHAGEKVYGEHAATSGH